jgi:ABC-type branched-subunit amino acid transport system ATPase component
MFVPRGSIAGLIGPNGAGKTTIFNMIAGIYQPSEGEISFAGAPLVSDSSHGGRSRWLRPDQVTARGIARTFQNIRLFANMSALDNVLIGMHCRLKSTPLGAVLRLPSVNREENESRARARELLDYVGLRGQGPVTAKNLAYGDQRRLEIARALASQPKLLLLDEPSLGLAPLLVHDIFTIIGRLNRDAHVTILLVEQNAVAALRIADYGYVMESGRIVLDGDAEKLRMNEDVREFYLGLTEVGRRKSYRDVKHYRRRKRWLS